MILKTAATRQQRSQILAARTSGLRWNAQLGAERKSSELRHALAKQNKQNISQAKPARLVCRGVKAKLNAHTAKLKVMKERGNKMKRALIFAS